MPYIPHTDEERSQILNQLGLGSIGSLFDDIPSEWRNPPWHLKEGIDPIRLTQEMETWAQQNTSSRFKSFLGGGAYAHSLPPLVDHLASRNEFVTTYTPYQAELSQGLLQVIFEFQSMICELTGLDVANASLYDGATALWEAMLMAVRVKKRRKIAFCDPFSPRFRSVIETAASCANIALHRIPEDQAGLDRKATKSLLDESFSALVVPYPHYLGGVEDLDDFKATCDRVGALLIVCVHPIACAVFRSPGDFGADIAVGEGQSLGNPLAYGGPYLGFMATRRSLIREMPGRLCGETVDAQGRRGFVLTLQTREQHIRRDKATSNVCSNQALLALRATIYLAHMGPQGLREVAEACRRRLAFFRKEIGKMSNFDMLPQQAGLCEGVLILPFSCQAFQAFAQDRGLLPGLSLASYNGSDQHLLVAFTETAPRSDIIDLLTCLEEARKTLPSLQHKTKRSDVL